MAFKMAVATLAFLAIGAGLAYARHRHGAPEIDGPAGIAAAAFIVSVSLLAYNRFKK